VGEFHEFWIMSSCKHEMNVFPRYDPSLQGEIHERWESLAAHLEPCGHGDDILRLIPTVLTSVLRHLIVIRFVLGYTFGVVR